MMMSPTTTFEEMREFARSFEPLQEVEVPDGIAPTVLFRVGLVDLSWSLSAPIGPILIAASHQGISAVSLGADREAFEASFKRRLDRDIRWVDQPPASLERKVQELLADGSSKGLPFDLRGLSEFEQAVLRKALEIPRGEVRPYNWIAQELGRPGASRAVGSALANNPVPLLIPCHRVVRQDGTIGNYLFGTEVKRSLLELESAAPRQLELLARGGVRYFGSDTTKIFCFPTCRHARRVTETHLVHFHSEAEARSAGYRPCKVCRPAVAS
jgi:O-6-methylguanine DNA methyltransferase